VEKYLKTRGESLPSHEIKALVKCDTSAAAQKVIDKMIARERAIIQSSWSEEEYQYRAGFLVQDLCVTQCGTPGEVNGGKRKSQHHGD